MEFLHIFEGSQENKGIFEMTSISINLVRSNKTLHMNCLEFLIDNVFSFLM